MQWTGGPSPGPQTNYGRAVNLPMQTSLASQATPALYQIQNYYVLPAQFAPLPAQQLYAPQSTPPFAQYGAPPAQQPYAPPPAQYGSLLAQLLYAPPPAQYGSLPAQQLYAPPQAQFALPSAKQPYAPQSAPLSAQYGPLPMQQSYAPQQPQIPPSQHSFASQYSIAPPPYSTVEEAAPNSE